MLAFAALRRRRARVRSTGWAYGAAAKCFRSYARTRSPFRASTPASSPAAGRRSRKLRSPAGTHIPLVLHNAISTRSARAGDPVYLETLFPVMVDGRVVIPAGSYVSGEITESKRPGRVKGRGELMVKLTTIILPNAYMVQLNATPGGSPEPAAVKPWTRKAKLPVTATKLLMLPRLQRQLRPVPESEPSRREVVRVRDWSGHRRGRRNHAACCCREGPKRNCRAARLWMP